MEKTSIELLGLSGRSYNALRRMGIKTISDVMRYSEEELCKMPHIGKTIVAEVMQKLGEYLGKDGFSSKAQTMGAKSLEEENNISSKEINKILYLPEYKEQLLQYVKVNDYAIEEMGLSTCPKNRLKNSGCQYLSDFIFKTEDELMDIPKMGNTSVKEILKKINDYLSENKERMLTVIQGDESALWSDESIQLSILKLYKKEGFHGLYLEEIIRQIELPDIITIERIKKIIANLIKNNELEYENDCYYRIYEAFKDVLCECPAVDDKTRKIIQMRLQGRTLESIGKEFDYSRERIRQIEEKSVKKVRDWYKFKTGKRLFAEDYYRYLYETYTFDKKDIREWLHVPEHVWNYLDAIHVKKGKIQLNEALEDRNLNTGMRIKIKNYLNRNKLFVDNMWVEKNRADLEEIVARKCCVSDVTFDEYYELYNEFLRYEGVSYDESIYYTEDVYETRKNRIMEARFVLWKQNSTLRYYNIDSRDYTELIDTINLQAYENIELSTLKFFNEHPKVMEKYDIHDQYELHNLLRKIIPAGSYHDFSCGRMPTVKFGEFDRNAAIYELLVANAPISLDDFTNLIHSEYGYDQGVIQSTYLQPFAKYYYQGMYTVEQKIMSAENKKMLLKQLAGDFYYLDELRKIYIDVIPNADVDEINPYNLKEMGFIVLSKYVLRNHSSLEAYCEYLFTKEDVVDLTPLRRRMTYVQMFSSKLMEMKRNLEIVEFAPNQIISFRKLEESGITKELITTYCNDVYNFVKEGDYFNISSIRKEGFYTELFEFGFEEWFYANLLLSDDRFSFGNMFGTIVLYKGEENITIQSFERALIRNCVSIDVLDLISLLENNYGCKTPDKADVIYKVQGTEIYYDKILERFYATVDEYYRELDLAETL